VKTSNLKILTPKSASLVSLLLLLLTIEYVLSYYASEGILSKSVLYIFNLFPLLNLVIIWYSAKVYWSDYRVAFLLYYIFMLLNTALQAEGDLGDIMANVMIYLSVMSAFFLSTVDSNFLVGLFKKIAVLGIGGFAYIISTEGVDIDFALQNRGYTFHEMFYYASLFWAVIPGVILAVIVQKKLGLMILYWFCAVVLNLIFLKRFIIVDSVLLLLVTLLINFYRGNKISGGLKVYIIMAFVLGIGLYFSSNFLFTLFDATSERIESTTDDLSQFERFIEHRNYFTNEANALDILFGKGFSAYHKGLGNEAYSLHNGWANFIFKGGLILLLLILFPFVKMLSFTRDFKKLPADIQFSVALLLINVPRLFYTNMDNFQPVMLVFFFALFKIVDYKGNSLVNGVR
jgi:hypothetical protein